MLLLIAFVCPIGINEVAYADSVPWKKKINGSGRWRLVLDKEAVYDKETGLVWDRSPSTTKTEWVTAVSEAVNKSIGGRKGWRLPTVEELNSLIDQTQSDPALLAGHPFLNVQSDDYWTATSYHLDPKGVWTVRLLDGSASFGFNLKSGEFRYVWYVRGGYGYDVRYN